MELTTLERLQAAKAQTAENLEAMAETSPRRALSRAFLNGVRFAMDELRAESQGPKPEQEKP